MRRRTLTFLIAAVLLFFFIVPISFLLYGGVAAAIGGIAVIAALAAIQLPGFILLKKFGALPEANDDEARSIEGNDP
jgi:hypothetical protein